MHISRFHRSGASNHLAFFLLAAIAIFLSPACSTMPVTTPVILEQETLTPPPTARPKRPKPITPEPEPVEEPWPRTTVTVIVSSQSPLFMQVATSLMAHSSDPVTIIDLEKIDANSGVLKPELFLANQQVVALGERSTQWLKGRTSDFIEVLTSAAQPSGRHVPALPDPA